MIDPHYQRISDFVWDLGNIGASNRDHSLYQFLDSLALTYHKKYENLNYDFYTNGEYNLLKKLSSKFKIDTIIDVGANIGEYTCLAQKITDTEIYSFEPVAETYSQLVEKVSDVSKIKTYNLALGDFIGETFINVHDDNTISSMLNLRPNETELAKIKITRGDVFFKDIFEKNKLYFLKIDTEGFESNVLSGFGHYLKFIDVIQFEYGKASLTSKYHLIDFYNDYNKDFLIGKIYPNKIEFHQNYHWGLDDHIGPNYVMINRKRDDIIGNINLT